MSNFRTELSVDLRVMQVGKDKFSTMVLEFPEGYDRAIKTFDPERLYLEDVPGDRYSMVDTEGHRYCGIEKHEEWIEAAEDRGIFFLVMQSDLKGGQVTGRVLVVRYPFGQILRDTSTFRIDAHDFNLAALDGRLIQKAVNGIKLPDLKISTAN